MSDHASDSSKNKYVANVLKKKQAAPIDLQWTI